jgi:toluene monooxygenase system ferredoxin subunit
MAYTKALPRDELWIGEMRSCNIAGRRVLLVGLPNGVCAYEDRCAHLGIPLSDGTLRDGVITCSAHGFQYDASTGLGINPKNTRLAQFPVRIEDDHICVELIPAGGDASVKGVPRA